MPEDWAQIKL